VTVPVPVPVAGVGGLKPPNNPPVGARLGAAVEVAGLSASFAFSLSAGLAPKPKALGVGDAGN
jgi:hypothetical protein